MRPKLCLDWMPSAKPVLGLLALMKWGTSHTATMSATSIACKVQHVICSQAAQPQSSTRAS